MEDAPVLQIIRLSEPYPAAVLAGATVHVRQPGGGYREGVVVRPARMHAVVEFSRVERRREVVTVREPPVLVPWHRVAEVAHPPEECARWRQGARGGR